ncbi:TAXI family TRAP transporter solute-binding subunit [Chloroflexota bacterium]
MKKLVGLLVLGIILVSLLPAACTTKTPAPSPAPTVTVTTTAPAPTPTEPEHEIVRTELLMNPHSAGSYKQFAVLEQIIAKRHPWLRLVVQETPGHIYNATVFGAEKARWPSQVCGLDPYNQAMAKMGLQPLYEEPLPDIGDMQVLFAYTHVLTGFLTTNPDIKTIEDLDGKRVGVGLRSQSGWAQYPRVLIEIGYPNVNATIEYMDISKQPDALLDGLVDAVGALWGTNKQWDPVLSFGSTAELQASGRDIYHVKYDLAAIERVKVKNIPFIPIEIPANTLPIAQPEAMANFLTPYYIYAHKSFPEDIAYEIVKTVIEVQPEWAEINAMAKFVPGASLCWGVTEENGHPGAIRAYKEAGLWGK